MSIKRVLALTVIIIAAVALAAVPKLGPLVMDRYQRHQMIQQVQNVQIPQVTERPKQQEAKELALVPPRRDEVNWNVPFTVQAPYAVWDELHEDLCEEASILMVLRYFAGDRFRSLEDAEGGLVYLMRLSEKLYGVSKDQTANQVAGLIAQENDNLRVTVVANPTEESLKAALDEGAIAIIPAAGRLLKNPYFRAPGPLYHMFVLRGYTKDGYAITNDPGTKRGENFLYSWENLLEANHDWNDEDVLKGDRVAIIVREYVKEAVMQEKETRNDH